MDTHEQDDLTELERRLGSWRPEPGTLDRDRILFDAGRASVRARPWYLTTAALTLLAIGLGSLLVRERAKRQDLEVALAERNRKPVVIPETPPLIVEAAPDSYLVLTHRAMSGGLDDPMPTRAVPKVDLPPGAEPPFSPLRVRDLGGIMDL